MHIVYVCVCSGMCLDTTPSHIKCGMTSPSRQPSVILYETRAQLHRIRVMRLLCLLC